MTKLRIGFGLLWIVMLVLTPAAGSAQDNPQVQVTDQIIADFDEVVEAEMAYFHIPGVAIAIIQDGEVVHTRGFGVRDLSTGDPFTPETRFRVGSTTKSMTSLLVAQLVDEGKLSWDTPVGELLPGFQTADPELTAHITVRDLMGMGTGLVSDTLKSLDWNEWTVDDLLAAVAEQAIAGDFRQYYSYNNEVYALAGYLAVLAAGNEPTLDNYKALLQTRIFDPVGMSSAMVTDDLSLLGDNYSRSYELSLVSGVANPSPALPAPIHVIGPSGGVWTNINDMSRYLITQMNGGITPDGTQIVSAENLAETWKPGVITQPDEDDTRDIRYGMGWVNMTFRDNIEARWHDGGWEGYRTLMVVLPESNVGLIIFTNHTYGDLYNFAMLEAFAEMLYGLEPQAITNWHEKFEAAFGAIDEQVAQLPPAAIDPEDAAPLLGSYESDWTLEQRDDNTLWLIHGPWQFMLLPVMPNTFIIDNSGAAGTLVQFSVEGNQVSLTVGEGEISLTVPKLSE